MTMTKLMGLTTPELVARFEDIALEQDKALAEYWPISVYTRLFHEMNAVAKELKSRQGDQRRALVHLMESSNLLVRLRAATITLPVAYVLARSTLESIKALGVYPEAGEAAGLLNDMDKGLHNPT